LWDRPSPFVVCRLWSPADDRNRSSAPPYHLVSEQYWV
jgi:hypothetical protein